MGTEKHAFGLKNMHLDYQHDYLQYGRKVVDDALV